MIDPHESARNDAAPPVGARYPLALLALGLAALIWSGIAPAGRINWIAETLPAMIGAAILLATAHRFRLTNLNYTLIWLFSLILIVGGHYTYADVPIGNWARDTFNLSRNHFDRVGHFFQGVIPAMLARELLIRTSPLRPGKWLFVLCLSVALAVSATYELIEWQYAAYFGGDQANDFLGSQGDIWDAQKDMLMAAVGAAVAQLFLSRLHDRQISQINK